MSKNKKNQYNVGEMATFRARKLIKLNSNQIRELVENGGSVFSAIFVILNDDQKAQVKETLISMDLWKVFSQW